MYSTAEIDICPPYTFSKNKSSPDEKKILDKPLPFNYGFSA